MEAATAIVGQTLAHYRIVAMLGEGGMGRVYRAEDTRLGREVALKILPPELAGSRERLARFQLEAEALASVDHPNIVTIHSVEEADEAHFFTMQLVEGRQLADLIPRRGMPLRRILDTGIPLAEALAVAHERGIIHRDLKPSNIMVTDDDRVKVLDFGLAKLHDWSDGTPPSELATETLTGGYKAMGTVPYMSPEQVEGKRLDHRSDLFALGVILYELATGQRPFQGASPASVMTAILRDTPPLVTALSPALPQELAKIIRRCLVKQPDHRFQTARELAIELEELRGDLESGEVPRPVYVPRRRRVMPWALAAAGIVGAALVALGLWLLTADRTQPMRASKPVHIAVVEELLLPGERERDGYRSSFAAVLEEGLVGLEGVFLVRTRDLESAGDLQGPEPDLLLQFDIKRTDGIVTTSTRLLRTADNTVLGGEVFEGSADEPYEVVNRIGTITVQLLRSQLELDAVYHPMPRRTTVAEAFDLYLEAWERLRDREAPESHAAALGILDRALALDSGFAAARSLKGRVLLLEFQETFDPDLLEAARSSCARSLELDKQSAAAHVCLGEVQRLSDRPLAAIDQYLRAIELNGAEVAAYTGLRQAHVALGMPPTVEATWKKVVAENPEFWASHYHLGGYYHDINDYEAALKQYERALELAPNNFIVAFTMGGAQWYLGRYPEAALSFEDSIRIRPDFRAFSNLGYNYLQLGQLNWAVEAFERAVEFEDATWIVWGNLGKGYALLEGRRAEAESALQHAVSMCRARLDANPENADILTQMAHYLAILGEREASVAALETAARLRHGDAHDFYTRALIHLALGSREAALDALRLAVAAGYPKAEIMITPELDSLRDDVRYREILGLSDWH